jgi:hypothetical protein
VFFDRLGEWIGAGVILAGVGFQSVEKVFTEQYRPWSGECLCSLVGTQKTTVLYVDSPELVQLMKVDDFHRQVRSGQGVAYSSAPDLARFPQINAPDSNGKILQHSGVSCGTGSGFVKIRLTSGPNKRKAGWACEADLRRTAGGQ